MASTSTIPSRDHQEGALVRVDGATVEWQVSPGLTEYLPAVAHMEHCAKEIAAGHMAEQVWLVEHPPVITAGTSANPAELVEPDRFAVHQTGRGGRYTYHGPGQRVVYVMLDLNARKRDVRRYVGAVEAWIISSLAEFNIKGETRADRVGVWVRRPERSINAEDKIAAIGVRVRRWVTFHGISLNVDPDLAHFRTIVPCGVTGHGVTSLVDLGLPVVMEDADIALKRHFTGTFGPVADAAPPVLANMNGG